jgi:hypothetical protein
MRLQRVLVSTGHARGASPDSLREFLGRKEILDPFGLRLVPIHTKR